MTGEGADWITKHRESKRRPDRLKAWLDDWPEEDSYGARLELSIAALRAVVDYCDRELTDDYPEAFASDIKAIIEREVFGE